MRPHRQAGFTLVEALVALTILVLALTAFYRALSDGSRANYAAATRDDALLYALSHLDRLGVDLLLTSGSGEYPDGSTWRLQVNPVANTPASGVSTHWVELSVARDGADLLRLRTGKIGRTAP